MENQRNASRASSQPCPCDLHYCAADHTHYNHTGEQLDWDELSLLMETVYSIPDELYTWPSEHRQNTEKLELCEARPRWVMSVFI